MYNFTNEAEELVKKGEYGAAFDIVAAVLEAIPETDIDDSEGTTSDVADDCIMIMKSILDKILDAENELSRQILNYIEDELKQSI